MAADDKAYMKQESDTKELILETSLQAFFYDQLQEINRKSNYPLPNEAIYYSSLVMDKFGLSGHFFEENEGKVSEKVLGIKLLESSNLSTVKQKRILRDIGDTALFVCGYFSDSLKRKLVDESYYQNLGRMAYKRLNHIIPDAYKVPSFFKVLAKNFTSITTLMSVVSKMNEENASQFEESFVLFVANNTNIKAS